MTHLTKEAIDLLDKVKDAMSEEGSSKARHAALLLPEIAVILEKFIFCLENLSQNDSQMVFMRKTLEESIQELINAVWQVNDEVGKITGFDSTHRVPTRPLQAPMIRASAALDQMQMLLRRYEDC